MNRMETVILSITVPIIVILFVTVVVLCVLLHHAKQISTPKQEDGTAPNRDSRPESVASRLSSDRPLPPIPPLGFNNWRSRVSRRFRNSRRQAAESVPTHLALTTVNVAENSNASETIRSIESQVGLSQGWGGDDASPRRNTTFMPTFVDPDYLNHPNQSSARSSSAYILAENSEAGVEGGDNDENPYVAVPDHIETSQPNESKEHIYEYDKLPQCEKPDSQNHGYEKVNKKSTAASHGYGYKKGTAASHGYGYKGTAASHGYGYHAPDNDNVTNSNDGKKHEKAQLVGQRNAPQEELDVERILTQQTPPNGMLRSILSLPEQDRPVQTRMDLIKAISIEFEFEDDVYV